MGRLVDYFIPDQFGEESIERKRAEIAVGTAFVMVPFGLMAVALTVWLYSSMWMVMGMALLPLLMAVAPSVLRRTGNLTWASAFILVPMYGVVTWYAWSTGGLYAPAVSTLLLLPPLAMVYLGRRAAIIWLVVVLGTWGAMFGAEMMTVVDGMAQFDEEQYPVRRISEMIILAGVVTGLFVLKDNVQNWLTTTLRNKEAETRAVVETAPDGILTVNLDGEILTINDAGVQVFGCSRDALVGTDIRELIPSLERDLVEDIEYRETEEHTGRCRGQTETFPVEVAFGLIDIATQDEKQLVLVFRDITDRKEAEQQLRTARDRALEASQAKSTFLANMSHELRTPLNAVIGYSEMMLEEIGLLKRQRRDEAEEGDDGEDVEDLGLVEQFVPDINRIHSAGEHLLALINDILDLSKIEAGKMMTHVERFRVADLCDEIAGTVKPLADKNDNDFVLDCDEGVGAMNSDATKVRQILFNLLSNACKFTEDGEVRLVVSRNEDDDEIVFVVEDTGIGMDEEQLETVFEAFQQADTSTTREFGGTGLGLTITSHFCAMLNGDISVESESGEGTAFTVRLAANLKQQPDQSTGNDEPTPTRRTHRATPISGDGDGSLVLVVDDDPTVRDLLGRILENEGYQVVTAANGSEAYLLAEKLTPDVITLDVMMPAMDGWTLLTKLKEDSELGSIPVVMVSMLSDHSRGYALGADGYLVKPVDRNELLETLDAVQGATRGDGQILVVEDDEPTRSLMRRVLDNDGWNVIEATNGVEGMERLEQDAVDLVLLDLMMPKMDGFEFLHRMREDAAYDDVSVIIVTAKELTDQERNQLEGHVTGILGKGGRERDELLDDIRRIVTRYVD